MEFPIQTRRLFGPPSRLSNFQDFPHPPPPTIWTPRLLGIVEYK